MIDAPAFSACFSYLEILDIGRFNEDNIFSQQQLKKTLNKEEIDEILASLLIKEIFKYSPNETSELIDSCRFRTPGTYRFDRSIDAATCYKVFKIHKFFFGGLVCYRFMFTLSRRTFTHFELAFAPRDSALIFEVKPGERLARYKEAKIVVHSNNTYPAKSIALSPLMERIHWNDKNPQSKYTLEL